MLVTLLIKQNMNTKFEEVKDDIYNLPENFNGSPTYSHQKDILTSQISDLNSLSEWNQNVVEHIDNPKLTDYLIYDLENENQMLQIRIHQASHMFESTMKQYAAVPIKATRESGEHLKELE